ncbi:translocation/assembly module TamB domain-containing protein [Gloeocapsa sp. PCC 73106]|uniref:translocation/assembly module TamB domain-containing protein n=1 Tax=Gloeocapsa sp. PCC 73106 TaxID=102232 RepID=UPI00130E64C7|nr:translocation/assembly module TamB domain-containing protein [Gloeocapsa sp. PCC 73106]
MPQSNKSKRRYLYLGIGSVFLISVGGSLSYGWFLLHHRLSPLIETKLTTLLDRPVNLGEIEGFSPIGGISFDHSSIPATPEDPNYLEVESIKINFNLWQLLSKNKLNLRINLIKPTLYLQKSESQGWLPIDLTKFLQLSNRRVNLQYLNLTDAKVTLVSRSALGTLKTPVQTSLESAQLHYFRKERLIEFTVQGQLSQRDNFQLGGTMNLQTEAINLLVRGNQVDATQLSNLLSLPLSLEAGTVDGNLEIKLRKQQPPQIWGIGTLKDVQITLANLPESLTQTQGELRFQEYQINLEIRSQLGSIPLNAQGVIDTQKGLNLQAQTQPTEIIKIIQSLKLPTLPVTIQGEARSQIAITGFLRQPQFSIQIFNHQSISVAQTEFQSVYGVLNVQDQRLVIEQFQALPSLGGETWGTGYVELGNTDNFWLTLGGRDVPVIPLMKLETVEVELFGSLSDLAQVKGKGRAQLSLGEGTILVNDWEFSDSIWDAKVTTLDLKLSDFGINHSYLATTEIKTDLNISGKLGAIASRHFVIALNQITATGETSLTLADAEIITKNFQLTHGVWSTEINTSQLDLSSFITGLNKNNLNGNLYLSGTIGSSLEQIQAQGYGNLDLASGGRILVEEFSLSQQQFSTLLLPDQVNLEFFSNQLSGHLTGRVQLNTDLTGVKAAGKLTFSEGITLIDSSFTTTFNWDGALLNLENITGESIQGQGWLEVTETGKIAALELDINTATINLAKLNEQLAMAGLLNFQGKLKKTNNNLQINGELAVSNLEVPGLVFDPLLEGTIITQNHQNIDLKLGGKDAQIQVSLDSNYHPNHFLVQQGESILEGDRSQNNLLVTAQNLPLEIIKLINLPQVSNSLEVSGQLSGDATINLTNLDTIGNLQITAPFFGKLKGEQLTAKITYSSEILSINNLKLEQGLTAYLGEIELNFQEQIPQVQAQLNIEQAKIQDILETLQLLELSDFILGTKPHNYGKANSITNENGELSQGLPHESILYQLSLIAQLNYQNKQTEKSNQETIELPDLKELTGNVNGNLALSGYLNSSIKANFNFEGKNWEWGDYQLNQLLIEGNLSEETITLKTINLKTGASQVNFSGYINKTAQKAQLNVTNVPLTLIENMNIFPKNLAIAGKLNGQINIGGSRDNPQAQGDFSLEELMINKTLIYTTRVSFGYKNANLKFALKSLLSNKIAPINLEGSFPYQFPFATIKPQEQYFNLSLNIQDQGLTLINMFTQEMILWKSGQGQVDLNISGIFDQTQGKFFNLNTEGRVNLKDGVIISQLFPDNSFNQIQGEVLFDFNKIQIEKLTGSFSGGNFVISGNLPLIPSGSHNESLKIDLDYLTMDLTGLYQGGVAGNLRVFGSILEPYLTGELNLSQGQVFLADPANTTARQPSYLSRIEFDGLQLHLQQDIKLIRPPILSFIAGGTLNLSGNFTNPRPEGTIELKQGGVNLFTTYFRLGDNANNRARFFPYQGLDPYLEVELIGSVTESNSQDLLRDPSSSEISDLPVYSFNSVETIRIQANVKGFASQLTNSLELSSSPPKTEQEIIALLGGSFVNTSGTGETTLGLANLAGSALFGSFQGELADSLGLSEFRIFPAPVIQQERGTENFGLAAEIGVDISRQFSFSLLKVLTNTEPPQFGVRYRLNENLLIRGSTNFSKDTRGVFEYQLRF